MVLQKVKFSKILSLVLFSFCLILGSCNEEKESLSNPQQAQKEKQSDPQLQKNVEKCCTAECSQGSCTAYGSDCSCTCSWWGNPDCESSGTKKLQLSEDFKDFHDDIYADVVSTWDQSYKHEIKGHFDSLKDIYDESNGQLNSEEDPSLYENYVYHNEELDNIAENELTDSQREEVINYISEY